MKFSRFLATSIAFTILSATPVFAQANPSPTIEIVTPGEEQTIYGNKIPILFSVENFQIVDYQTNPKSTSGQGHIHLWLDDTSPTPKSAIQVADDNYTLSDVSFGEHTLKAGLVGNDHSSLKPSQTITVKFTNNPITSPSPAISTSGFDKNTALVIFVVVGLVIIAAWWYTKEEDEEETKSQSAKSKSKTITTPSKRRATKKRRS